ncbi:sigma factor [Streptomyces sp. NPDC088768]|uniref:sigma factor n=1 Tax=Streptomyces sp. NPDC088768 TaxID=3365894 RepID=UPI00382181B9
MDLAVIRAAQNQDLNATTAVIRHMESRISAIAGSIGNASSRDDLTQAGRIALWEALPRFDGDSLDGFYAFMHRTLYGAIQEAAREERQHGATGADRDATKIFAACMRTAGGDPAVAEQLAQTLPPKGRRLSPLRAHAARMAWESPLSLDAPNGTDGDDDTSLTHTLVSDYGIPDDLVTAEDRNRKARETRGHIVRAVISTLGAKQGHTLRATYGIGETPCLGSGAEADREIAAELGSTPGSVKVMRHQAHKNFGDRYTRITGFGE